MKLAYITVGDAFDIKHWSGIPYYMSQNFERQSLLLEYIGSLRKKYSLLVEAKIRLYFRLKQRYLVLYDPIIFKDYANQVSKRVAGLNVDVILSPWKCPIAALKSDRPIVFWADATFAGLKDFYPAYSNLCRETVRSGRKMDQISLERSRLAIYASDWAAQTAIDNYAVDPSKVKVVPFGANIEHNENFEGIKQIIDSRPSDKCKLLFLGVDWLRKGGDIAFQVSKTLNASGLVTELTVVGCDPIIDGPLPNFVKPMGFINKSTQQGFKRLTKLLAETHFLIVPSMAECYGIVFCEANSFGVPSISTNVGGIPTVIKDNINGKKFSKDATISEYCTYISDLFSDYTQYKELALSSFNEYFARLNWSVASRTVKKLLESLD